MFEILEGVLHKNIEIGIFSITLQSFLLKYFAILKHFATFAPLLKAKGLKIQLISIC